MIQAVYAKCTVIYTAINKEKSAAIRCMVIDRYEQMFYNMGKELSGGSSMNIYKTCPDVHNERFRLRLVTQEDCEDLLKVYSDVNRCLFSMGITATVMIFTMPPWSGCSRQCPSGFGLMRMAGLFG